MTAIEACEADEISPQVAIAQLLFAGLDRSGIMAALDRRPGSAAVAEMRALVVGRGEALDALAAEVRATAAQHSAAAATPAEGVAAIAAFFDRAVQHSPEASVGLYSLGDPAILAAATAEIVAWLSAQRLLREGADVLDLGCGIGRVSAALAPHCASVLAIDVSAGMVAEASRRLAALPHVVVRRTGGEDLDWLGAGTLDLVLAVDSFPYIVQAGGGTALRHVRGAMRALRPGGALCVLNLSYREDMGADRAEAAEWAAETGSRVLVDGTRPFRLWDGTAFVLAR